MMRWNDMREKLKPFARRHFGHFNRRDFFDGRAFRRALLEISGWTMSSALILVLASHCASERFAYVSVALNEAVGPHLWNTLGCIAMSISGLSLLFPRVKQLAWLSTYLFMNVFVIGALMLGVLVGGLMTSPSAPGWSELHRYLALTVASVLSFVLFLFNLFAWYLSWLFGVPTSVVGGKDASRMVFLEKCWAVVWWVRWPVAWAIIILPLYLLAHSKP